MVRCKAEALWVESGVRLFKGLRPGQVSCLQSVPVTCLAATMFRLFNNESSVRRCGCVPPPVPQPPICSPDQHGRGLETYRSLGGAENVFFDSAGAACDGREEEREF